MTIPAVAEDVRVKNTRVQEKLTRLACVTLLVIIVRKGAAALRPEADVVVARPETTNTGAAALRSEADVVVARPETTNTPHKQPWLPEDRFVTVGKLLHIKNPAQNPRRICHSKM